MIDERDVRNMLRHMYLLTLEGEKVDEEWREEVIESLLEDQRLNTFTDYNCDLGSKGFCPPGCRE